MLGPKVGNEYSADYKKENIISRQGTSQTYRIAKLKRDHPDVATRMEAGEFDSVSAAERAAGIRKPLMTAVERVCAAGVAETSKGVEPQGDPKNCSNQYLVGDKSENVTIYNRGNAQTYRIAKLKRDHPDHSYNQYW